LNGGIFSIRAKADAPGAWLVTWSNADRTVLAEHEAAWPGLPADIEAFWQECSSAVDEPSLAIKGRELYQFIMSGTAGLAWKNARNTWRLNPPLEQPTWHTSLAIEDETLRELPWEIMWDEARPVWTSAKETFSRVHQPTGDTPKVSLAEGWPWRLLILKGGGDGDAAVLSESETLAIHRAWWDLRHEVLIQTASPAGQVELEDLIEKFQPHILHFIGHAQPGALIFGAGGKSWTWNSTDIETFFGGRCPVPLLVWLNACQTASAGVFGAAVSNRSLQRTFFNLGAPFVAGMGGDINGELAEMQAAEFYQGIAAGLSLDVALAAARLKARTWRNDKSRSKAITFHQPFLVSLLRSTQGSAGLPIVPLSDKFKMIVRDTPQFKAIGRWFVDRHLTRRHLFDDSLDSDGRLKKNGKSRLIVVHGQGKTGKSWVLHCALKALASRGWLVRYHEMNGADSLDWLGVLNLIRHGLTKQQRGPGDEHSELVGPLPDASFKAFDAYVAQIAKAPAALTEELIKEAFDQFISGLRDAGQADGCQGVVLALDQIRGAIDAQNPSPGGSPTLPWPPWLKIWESNFFKPIGDGLNIPLIAFLGITGNLVKDSPLNQDIWKRQVDVISVEEVQVAIKLFFESCLGKERQNPDFRQRMNAFIRELASNETVGVRPEELRELYCSWADVVAKVTRKNNVPKIDDL